MSTNYTAKQSVRAEFSITHNNAQDLTENPVLMTPEGFFCFRPWLGEKKKNDDGGKDMFEVAFAMPKKCVAAKALYGKISEFLKAEFTTERGVVHPIKDGDKFIDGLKEEPNANKAEIEDKYGDLRGHVYFNAKSMFPLNDPEKPERPDQLLDVYLRPIDGKDVNGGDIARVSVAPYVYRKKGNKGVALDLRACQILAKGAYSGSGGGNAAAAFTADEPLLEDDAAGAFAGEEEVVETPDVNEGIEAIMDVDDAEAEKAALDAKLAADAEAEKKRLAAEKRKANKLAKEAKAKAEAEAAEAAEAAEDEEDEEDDADIGDSMFG